MPDATVRLMTWNVLWRFSPQWRDRQPLIEQTIGDQSADLVVLCESWGCGDDTQAGNLAGALGLHARFVAPSLPPAPKPLENEDQAGVQVGLGLLSRWPITGLRELPLPSRHRRFAPLSAVVTVDHPAGPLHLVATCLEWEPAYNDDRLAQGHAVTSLATDPQLDGPTPVLTAGDLNAAPDSPVLRPLRDALTDAWLVGGGNPAAVTLPSNHPDAPLEADELIDQRIDHVFYRPGQPGQRITVTGSRLAGQPIGGLYPSDHMAVVCDIAWINR